MQAPFSEAAERNKKPILEKLRPLLAASQSVLEIGSGTGQHAVFFSPEMPHLTWQPSELPEKLTMLTSQCNHYPAENLNTPISLDISDQWPAFQFDAVFTANTLHIIHWPLVVRLFTEIGARLPNYGLFCTYGPFNIGGGFTSESNAQFDHWLRKRDPGSGLRDIDDLQQIAEKCGLKLQQNNVMPANNQLLVWQAEK